MKKEHYSFLVLKTIKGQLKGEPYCETTKFITKCVWFINFVQKALAQYKSLIVMIIDYIYGSETNFLKIVN